MIRTASIALCFILASSPVIVLKADDAGSDPKTILETYLKALPALESAYGEAVAEGNLSIQQRRDGGRDTELETRHLSFEIHGHMVKLVVVSRSKPDIESTGYSEMAFVEGPNRTFVVSRTKENADWALNSVGPLNANWSSMFATRVKGLLRAPCAAEAMMNSRLLGSPRFHVTNTETVGQNELKLTRLKFRIDPLGKAAACEGWLLLEPSRKWIMHGYDYQILDEPPARFYGSVEYSPSKSDFPEPVRVLQHTSKRPGIVETNSFTFTRYSHEPPTESDFSMTAFGLGDFERPARHGRNSTVWWGLAAVASFVGLVATKLIARRRTGKAQARP